ncbi:hypothetical protein Pme01_09740 [Planosporangium mesophilum]|uniref:Uncharacterized protein n=1 Tax=Planosporangium mesophilum TaxID=689768 RepID=A0A8J3T8T3_9ACTN|nr:hypothetical protein Pme01_09740 [Planosporangium mesophilum]
MCHVTIHGSPTRPASPASRRRWLVVITTLWAVLVTGLALYAAHRGGSTVRTQTSVSQALPTVDRAVAEAVTAAAPAGAVAQVGGYHEVSGRCTVTAVRNGARYERVAHLYVPAGQEGALLDRIRAALPGDYDAQVRDRRLTADAGDFVALKGSVEGAGEVRISADTGCRPLTAPVREASEAADRRPVEAVLATLKVGGAAWQTHRVPCAQGGYVRTVQADGPAGSGPASLVDALRATAPDAVVARPELYAYRSGPVGIVARTRNGAVTVTATTGCGVQ